MDDNETLLRRARLRELIDSCFDGSVTKLIDFIGARTGKRPNQGEMSALKKDHGKSFGDKKAKKITEQVGLSRTWFSMPLGSHLTKDQWLLLSPDMQFNSSQAESKPIEINLSEHPDLIEVPRVKFKLSAGISGYSIETETGNGKPIFFRKDWFERNHYKPDRMFAVRVAGASMEPSLWDGDLVVINCADANLSDGDVFAINYEGELVIKRLRRDAGEWLVTSDNADHRRFSAKRCTEDVKIIGRVVYKQSDRI